MNINRLSALFITMAIATASCGGEPSGGSDAASGAANAPKTIEERGRAAFTVCAVCHSVKDPAAAGYAPMVGPSLYRVYGASTAHTQGYDYSKAMREATLKWDDATLDAYLANPQKTVPGTRMAYAGEPNAERRAAITAYLKTLK